MGAALGDTHHGSDVTQPGARIVSDVQQSSSVVHVKKVQLPMQTPYL